MKCNNCGVEIPEDSLFCLSCGAKVNAAEITRLQAAGAAGGEGAKTKKWYTRPWLYIVFVAVVAIAVLIITGAAANIVTSIVEEPGEPISFDSTELEGAVSRQLDIKDRKVTDKDIADVTELNLEGCGISDIEALAQFKGLTSLNLKGNKIRDLSPLATLQGLKGLNLSGNKVSVVEALSNLSSLETLNLSDNQISDITALAGLKSLTELSLQNDPIEDISPASQLTALDSIDLRGTKVKDISAVAGKTKIQIDKLEPIEIHLMPGEYFMIEKLKLPLQVGRANITWSSSDESVLTVEEGGKVQTTNVHTSAADSPLNKTAVLTGKIENVDTDLIYSINVYHDLYNYDTENKKTSYKMGNYIAKVYPTKIDPPLEQVTGVDLNYTVSSKKISKFTLRAAVNGKWKNFGTIYTKTKTGTVHINFGKAVKISKYWLAPKVKKAGSWSYDIYFYTIYYAFREANLGDLQIGGEQPKS